MKIATQNTIAIVPLFVAMAVTVGALAYTAARAQIHWGLQEETSSLAVSVAEFIDGDSTALPNGQSAGYYRNLLDPIDKVLARGQLRQVTLFTGDMRKEIYTRAPRDSTVSTITPSVLYDPALMVAMQRDSFYVSAEEPLDHGLTRVNAFAPVLDSEGHLVAILGVVTVSDILSRMSAEVLRRFAEFSALAVVLGLLASLFVSSLLARQTRTLSDAARAVANGQYDKQVNVGVIREMGDLSNTFNTMSSVLRDLVEKTRRALIESEQFRTSAGLAETYAEDADIEWKRNFGKIGVVSARVGRGHPADFCGAVETRAGVCVFIGRVEDVFELDSAVGATAALRFIKRELARLEPRDALQQTAQLFSVNKLKAVLATKDASSVEVCFFAPGTAPDCSPVKLTDTDSIVLHTFADDIRKDIGSYKRLYQHLPVDELAAELSRSLSASLNGTVLVIGRPRGF